MGVFVFCDRKLLVVILRLLKLLLTKTLNIFYLILGAYQFTAFREFVTLSHDKCLPPPALGQGVVDKGAGVGGLMGDGWGGAFIPTVPHNPLCSCMVTSEEPPPPCRDGARSWRLAEI